MTYSYLATLSLLVLCFCSICGAEDWPTPGDWSQLHSSADLLRVQTATDIKTQQNELDNARRHGPRSGRELAEIETSLRSFETVKKDLNAVLRELPDAPRTREAYRRLRSSFVTVRGLHSRTQAAIVAINAAQAEKHWIENAEARLIAPPAERIPAAEKPAGLALNWQNFPRLDGSTTTQPLAALLACRLLGLSAQWQLQGASGGEDSTERILAPICASPPPVPLPSLSRFEVSDPLQHGLLLQVRHSGTHTAYRNLILGVSSLILVAREPSPDELALARSKGAELDVRVIGYDAFVFLLHQSNPVGSLTVSQIQDIYQDNIFRWEEVGGSKQAIVAFQREPNSGSQETMEALVMKGLEIAPAERMLIGYGMRGPYNQLESTVNGLAYTFYYYHTVQAPKRSIKLCAVDGILPSAQTIQDGSYPFITEVYAVTRQNQDPHSSALKLRDWLLTPEGQALVQQSGYVRRTK